MKKSLLLFLIFSFFFSLGCAQRQVQRDGVLMPIEKAAELELESLQKKYPKDNLLRVEALKQFIEAYAETPAMHEARYLQAKAYTTQDLLTESYKVLNEIQLDVLSSGLQKKVLFLMASNAKSLGLYYEAVHTQIQLLQFLDQPEAIAKTKADIIESIEVDLEKDHVEALLGEGPAQFPAGYLHYRLGRILYDAADTEGTQKHFELALSLLSDETEKEKIQSYITELTKSYLTQPKVIGCILPLSGEYAIFGQKSLRGIQLALGFFGGRSADFELAIYDSQGDPDIARKGVDELLEKHGVIAIIGPLLQNTSEAVAKRAVQRQVPLINLSQHPSLFEMGEYIFQISMTKMQQTKALVKYACEQKGLKKYAILYPEDAYGIEFANQFWDAIESCEGEIVGISPYEPGQRDFNEEIKRLIGLSDPLSRKYEYQVAAEQLKFEQGRTDVKPDEIKLKPLIEFEAIFIPDYAKTAAQIAPTLAFYDVHNVLLLGTQGWHSQDLIQRGESYVQNSVFVDGFFEHSEKPHVQKFVQDFSNAFSEVPQIWQAQAYDAADLLKVVLKEKNIETRLQLKQELMAISEMEGVTGKMHYAALEGLQKDLFLLTVQKNRIQEMLYDAPPLEPTE